MRRYWVMIMALAACVCVSATASVLAEEMWSIDNGQTTIQWDQAALANAGLTVNDVQLSVPAAELQLNSADDSAIVGALSSVTIGHNATISFLTTAGVSVDATFSLNDANSSLQTGANTIHFDSGAGLAYVDADEVVISEALAGELGNAALAGTVIGRALTEMEISYRRGSMTSMDSLDFNVGGDDYQVLMTPCGGSSGPDVIVGDLTGPGNYSPVGGIDAFSVGTTSCNMGTANLLWQSGNSNHPVIGQNLYRYQVDSAGWSSMEQIGLSWLKHGFLALTGNLCCTCMGPSGSVLSPGCSDPYSSGLNGQQGWPSGGLGPRFEVDATTGVFPYPYTFRGQTGNNIYKRLQVDLDEINEGVSNGALFYFEGHYVTPDDAASGNKDNNTSYRRTNMGGSTTNRSASWIGSTVREDPAIMAWIVNDATVQARKLTTQEANSEKGFGWFMFDVTDNGDGTWHYEYAVYNMNSDRSFSSFTIPCPDNVAITNAESHHPFYHSGDGFNSTSGSPVTYDNTPWTMTHVGNQMVCEMVNPADNNGNAIRWGTTHNFRFDADTPPVTVNAELGYYKDVGVGNTPMTIFSVSAPEAGVSFADGDFDMDGDVDLSDFSQFSLCFGGANVPPAGSCPPGIDADFDDDGDVDLGDFAEFSLQFTGPI